MIICFGCQISDKKGNEIDDQIFDFAFIKKAPETTEKQDFNKVIKVYFNENDGSLDKGFAIDLEEETVYINPRMGSRGIRTSIEESIHVSEIDGVLKVLKKHNVQKWKDDYTFESPDSYQDGYGWQLWLQLKTEQLKSTKGLVLKRRK